MKKILFVTQTISPYRAEFLQELSNYFEVTVVNEVDAKAHTHRNSEWFQKCEGLNLTVVNLDEEKMRPNWWVRSEIVSIIKRKFDFIIMGGYSSHTQMYAIEYMKFKKIPFILSTDGGFIKKDNYIKKKIKTHFISSATVWLSTAKKSDEYLSYYGADIKKIHRYPFTSIRKDDILKCVCDKELKEKIKKELGIPEDKVIVSVGRFSYNNGYGKGFDLLLDVGRMIDKNIGIYIVGDEPTEEFTERISQEKITNIHFIPFQNKERLSQYYASADLFTLMTRSDIWGLVINEAMASGLPVITTDCCIAGLELVEDGKNGYIVKSEDVKSLKNRLEEILGDEKLRVEMANNSIKYINEYTIENMAKIHYDHLSNFIF